MSRLFAPGVRRAPARVFSTLAMMASLCTVSRADAQQPPSAPARPAPVVAPTPRIRPTPRPALAPMFDESWRMDVERAAMSATIAGADAARAGVEAARAAIAATVDAGVAFAPGFPDIEGAMSIAMNGAFDGAFDGAIAGAFDGFSGRADGRTRGYRTEPPVAWDAQDPADTLYRSARQALSSDEYRKAADLFKQIHERFPKSSYAADAPYWEAFALQRLGGDGNLSAALRALALQQSQYPRAATRGDAAALRARVQGMLARRGDAEMSATLMGRAVETTRDGCPRANEDERIDALNAVTQMDAEKAMPILKKVLARREPCTQQLRRTAVYLVASRKQPEAADILMNVAKTDPDREVREQAVFWIANVPTEEATTMLVDLARRGDDLELRKRAVYALSRSKSPRAASTLREIALDNSTPRELRAEVLQWYLASPARASGEDAMVFLKEVYGKADSEDTKQLVVMSMSAQRTEESRNFLLTLALNERESVDLRRYAVISLGTAGSSVRTGRGAAASATTTPAAAVAAAVAAVTQVYDKASALEVRRAALMSLGAARENAGVEKLIDIARNEKQPELRREAVSYLSRIKDPRALALLQEIIDR